MGWRWAWPPWQHPSEVGREATAAAQVEATKALADARQRGRFRDVEANRAHNLAARVDRLTTEVDRALRLRGSPQQ